MEVQPTESVHEDGTTSSTSRRESQEEMQQNNITSTSKRERTDSLKKLLPPPNAQRIKGKERKNINPILSPPSPMPTTGLVIDTELNLTPNSLASRGEKSNPRRWSKAEDEALRIAVERSGERNWKAIADQVAGRNHTQCLQRWTKVLKPGLIKVYRMAF